MIFFASNSSFVEFAADVKRAICEPMYWFYSSTLDTSLQYRNNRLGFISILLSSVLFVGVLGQLYHKLLNVSILEYSIHLYVGLTVWNFISHSITQSSNVVDNHKSLLASTVSVTIIDLVLRTVFRNLFVCLHNLVPIILFAFIWWPDAQGFLWFFQIILGLIVILIFTVTSGLLCCLLSTVLPDLSEILNAIFRIGFLATPIIWMQDKISLIDSSRTGLRYYIDFNPFYHIIELVRSPIFAREMHDSLIAIMVLVIITCFIIGLSYTALKKRIESTL